ncbi:hypothetical protein M9Y10_021388 [Tritrichomonas musculus]|uniref:Uncharacterized protein n=1 Tax=Tritrichomonas musculus TaxID=1915356 RepID=A0ABR2HDT4_9EUKA
MNRRKTSSTNQKNTTKPKRRNIKESSIPLKSVYVDVSNSNISTFRFLNRLQEVLSVNATNTLISDFAGAPLCSTIRNIKIQDSPISRNPNYRLMTLITINSDIEFIDNQRVTKDEKEKSLSLQPLVQPKLYDGFLLTSMDPVTLSRADETVVINSNDIKDSKSINRSDIKFNQTIEMMEKLSFDISNTSDEFGIGHIPKLPIRELLKQKKINATDFFPTNSSITYKSKKDTQSSFVKAFKEYTQTPEDLVESSILFDSPEKRKERHSLIMQDSPSHYSTIQDSNQNQESVDQIPNQKVPETEIEEEEEEINEQVSIEKLYDDVVEPNIPNKNDLTVEQIFGIASEIMGSPEKHSRLFEDNTSASSGISKIPVRLDSPSKNYGKGLEASRLTQTKFGGYRKITDTDSISSEADDFANSLNEEEDKYATTEDDIKINFSGFEEEEEEAEQNQFSQPSKDMTDQEWVTSEGAENKAFNEEEQSNENQEEEENLHEQELQNPNEEENLLEQPVNNEEENLLEQPVNNEEENLHEQELQNPNEEENLHEQPVNNEEENLNEQPVRNDQEEPSKDMPDPDWVVNEDAENRDINEQPRQELETTENQELQAEPSKDMLDPSWVINEDEENKTTEESKDLNEQPTQEEPAATENSQDLLDANEGNISNEQEGDKNEAGDQNWVASDDLININSNATTDVTMSEQDLINSSLNITTTENKGLQEEPSKDMPDPDWVVDENAENKDSNEQPSQEEQATNSQDLLITNQEGTTNENEIASTNESLENKELQEEPSKDMPNSNWIASEGIENIDSNETITEPATSDQALLNSNENLGNQPEAPENQELQSEPSKDMPSPSWVVDENASNSDLNEQPTQEEIPASNERDLLDANETPVNQELQTEPSKDMPDPSWVVDENAVNSDLNEQPTQEEIPASNEQPTQEEIPASSERDLLNTNETPVNQEGIISDEQAGGKNEEGNPNWAASDDLININSNATTDITMSEQDLMNSNEQPENQEQIENQEGNNLEEPAPPSKDMPTPDWVVPEDQVLNSQTKEATPNELEAPNSNETPATQEERAPPASDMTPETSTNEPVTQPETTTNEPTENQEEPAPPSKDMPTPDWVVSEDQEEQVLNSQTKEATPNELEAQNPNETPATQEEQAPPASDMTPETTTNETVTQPETPATNEPTENPEEPAPPSKDMPNPDWVVPEELEDQVLNGQMMPDAPPQEEATVAVTERSLDVENKEETSFNNYDPNVIAMLDQQVQPRETVDINNLPPPAQQQEPEQKHEIPAFESSSPLDFSTSTQEPSENQQEKPKDTHEVDAAAAAQESSSLEFSLSTQDHQNEDTNQNELPKEDAQESSSIDLSLSQDQPENQQGQPSWVIPEDGQPKSEDPSWVIPEGN